jgi:shikimate kinase
MGSGKSTVAALLASKLGWKNMDTDRWIEAEAGAAIAEIFKLRGEEQFRDLECRAIQAAALQENAVIALGGGALTREENLQTVLASGKLVFLSASVDSLMRRLDSEKEHRPLLRGVDEKATRSRIVELLNQRTPAYCRAHHEINTDGESAEETASRILQLLRQEENQS